MLLEKGILNSKKIGVVLCDAGGTNYIISLIEKFKLSVNYYCEGPALKIIKNYNSKVSLSEFIDAHDIILTSISWSSEVENEAIVKAKKKGKIVFTVLDHLVNFQKRFLLNGKITLPDSIILFDNYAFEKAKETFRNYKVKLFLTKSNYFVDKFINDVKQNSFKSNHILLIDEPIKRHYEGVMKKNFSYRGFNEFTAIEYFLDKMKNSKYINYDIDIKLHPSSLENKYDHILGNKVKVLNSKIKLENIISKYKIIVGFESIALYLASKLRSKIKVFTIIPPEVKNNKNIFELNSFYDI